MLAYDGDVFEPVIWTRATGRTRTMKLPAGRCVAETSDIRWTKNGEQVVVAVPTAEWRTKARASFAQITAGPVFVQTSKDPFLAWEDLRRMANVRSVGALNVKTGEYQELIPEAMITNYTLPDDGGFVRYTADQTKKTDTHPPANPDRPFA